MNEYQLKQIAEILLEQGVDVSNTLAVETSLAELLEDIPGCEFVTDNEVSVLSSQ